MIVKGDRFLIIRYSNSLCDCIANHKAVIDEYGYCWFGKIGVVPSEKTLKEKLNSEKPQVALYCQGEVYICQLLEVSHEKPAFGYPHYYQTLLFDRNIYPKIYFKIGSIEEFPKEIFAKCISINSKLSLAESVSKSMASFFYGEYPAEDSKPLSDDLSQKKNKDKNININIKQDKYSCIYKDAKGYCANRHCVNYNYKCERPQYCIKQKLKLME